MKMLLSIYRILGRWAFNLLLFPVVTYFVLTAGAARRSSRQYLLRVKGMAAVRQIPHLEKLTTFQHFMSFGDAILDKGAMWAQAFEEQQIEFSDPRSYDNFIADNRGSLFIGSHLGNLEVLRAYGEITQNMLVNALVYTGHSKKFAQILKQANPQATEHMIEVDSLGPESVLMLKERLAQGEHVAMVADRTSVHHEERSIRSKFLGHPAPFPEGPFVIAHLLSCPVYLLFCLKQRGAYRIFLEKFADPLELPRSNRQDALEQAVDRYARRLEHYCLLAPLQWFNFYDFWQRPQRSNADDLTDQRDHGQ